ncbi:MAG: hypothetical protein HC853_11495 [Anaerolineae bacterium]|nr:hypothetical protein [Anaerolineae bacterium]
MAMIRKQIYVEKRQDQALKQFVKKLGLTESEVIRRAIEFFAANQAALASTTSATKASQRAWQDFLKGVALSREQALRSTVSTSWNREALYEERMEELERRRRKAKA